MDGTSSWWRARWVAWTLGLTAIVLMAANLALMFVDRHAALPQTSDADVVGIKAFPPESILLTSTLLIAAAVMLRGRKGAV